MAMETVYDARHPVKLARPAERKKIDFLHRQLARAGARRVLELGVGRGNNVVELQGLHVVGVEISPDEAAIARSFGLDVHVGNARTWSDGQTYDAVICSEVIEHVADPPGLLRNCARHLVPGGILLLTTPNGYGPWEFKVHHLNLRDHLRRSNTLRRVLKKKPYRWGDSLDHCQWFTRGRLLKMAEDAGFTLLEQDATDFLSGSEKDCELASRLPSWCASGWMFVFRYDGKPAPPRAN